MFSFIQERHMTFVDPLGSLNNILMLTRQRRVSPDQNTRWYSLVWSSIQLGLVNHTAWSGLAYSLIWSSIQLALSGSGLGFCKGTS